MLGRVQGLVVVSMVIFFLFAFYFMNGLVVKIERV